MGDLVEIQKRKFLLVDTWDVRHQHFLISGFSILLFGTYGVFLWLLCSMTPSITASLLLLGSQIGLGLPATRAYFDFGVLTRRMLKFYDAGVLGPDVESQDLSLKIGDVPLVFEQLEFQIRKYDSGSYDDLNDIAWFTIFVWAVISSVGIINRLAGVPLCLLGVFVLLITCTACYISGYRTIQGASFEDDLHHLEYYVEHSIKSADKSMPNRNGVAVLRVAQQGRRTALIDIVVEFPLNSKSVLEYHIGLTSQHKERFILVVPPESFDLLYPKFKNLGAVKNSGWTLEQITTPSGRIVRIMNPKSNLSISDRTTFVVNPDQVERNILIANETLSEISKIIET